MYDTEINKFKHSLLHAMQNVGIWFAIHQGVEFRFAEFGDSFIIRNKEYDIKTIIPSEVFEYISSPYNYKTTDICIEFMKKFTDYKDGYVFIESVLIENKIDYTYTKIKYGFSNKEF